MLREDEVLETARGDRSGAMALSPGTTSGFSFLPLNGLRTPPFGPPPPGAAFGPPPNPGAV